MTLILWFHILSEKKTDKSKNKYQFKSDSKDKNEKKNIEHKIQSLSFICVLLLLKVHIRLFNIHKRFANYNMRAKLSQDTPVRVKETEKKTSL